MTYLYNLKLKSSLLTFGAKSLNSYNFDGKTVLIKKSFISPFLFPLTYYQNVNTIILLNFKVSF